MTLHSMSRQDRGSSAIADLRNFEVRSRSTEDRLGIVDDVLVDDKGGVRYLCVRREGDQAHTLLPAGHAEPDWTHSMVWVGSMAREAFRNVPTYEHDSAIDADYERRVGAAWDDSYSSSPYDRPEFRNPSWRRDSDRNPSGSLARLDKLDDYKVASGDPDPRGWAVLANDGSTLGEVDHLIGDTGNMMIRYLVVSVDRKIDENAPQILIPTGHVDLDTSRKKVVARGVDATCARALPRYDGRTVTPEMEQRVLTACEASITGERLYTHPRYRDEQFRADARRPAGGTRTSTTMTPEEDRPRR